METNYYGPLLSRAFAPVLAKNGGGAIVNLPLCAELGSGSLSWDVQRFRRQPRGL